MPTATKDKALAQRDFRMVERIISRLAGTRLDADKILAYSIGIVELESGPHSLVIELEHLVFDENGDKILKEDDTGYVTRTRKFRIPLGEEIKG